MAQPTSRVQAPLNATADTIDPTNRRPFYPIDGLVQAPPVPPIQNNTAYQLASALSSFSPKLEQYLNVSAAQNNAQDKQSAMNDAIKSGLTYKEALSRGVITPDQSPTYMATWQHYDGQNMATQTVNQAQQNYLQWDQRNAQATPQDVDKFWHDQTANATKDVTNPNILAGMTKRLAAFRDDLQNQQAEANAKNAQQGMQDALSTNIQDLVTTHTAQGTKLDAAGLLSDITGVAGSAKFAGVPTKVVDATIADAIVNKAEETNNKALLDVLSMDRIDHNDVTKTIPGYGRTVAGAVRIENAKTTIDNNIIVADNARHAQEVYDEGQRKKELQGSIMKTVYSGQAPDPKMLAEAGKLDPSIYEKVLGLQEAKRKYADYTPPAQAAALIQKMTIGDTNGMSRTDFLTKQITDGNLVFSTAEQPSLYARMAEYDDRGVDKNPTVGFLLDQIKKNADGSGNALFKDPSAAPRVGSQFLEDMMTWTKAHPQATAEETGAAARDSYDKVMKWNKSVFPNSMSPDSLGDASARPGGAAPATPPAATAPPPRPDQTAGSAFSAPSPSRQAAALQNIGTDGKPKKQAVEDEFIRDFGRAAYEALKRQKK